ncbi:uncharacterized protein isoform X3 [Rhodnius prolixus]|uniref:uncharacterized protein isoform X3 n=1 Tax=Rhodnius prolixus TaxID=13249 RepID=UPI003D18FA5E
MKRVINFVKGKRDEKKDSKVNPTISVEITNPSGQKITTDDEHIMGLQPGYGYSIDINGKDRNMLKIHKAAWFGNVEKLKLHSKKTDINTVDAMNRTCLHLAVAQGHTEVAWYLLNNNASMTIADNEGLTPFLKAIECGHKDCANLLIECGVDVNSTDKNGNTGLHIAAKSGFYNIATLLLKEGANFNLPNNAGECALHIATSGDHREIVELLLKFGANVEVLDRERRTPLMLAARGGLCSIVKILLDSRACLETADSNGWTAEDYAQFGGHQDLIDLLKVQKKEETNLDQSDKLSVQSSDPSENCFEKDLHSDNVVATDDQPDSPRSCVIPPALEPPRSWDLIQSGVIDQEGTEVKRKSLITLSGLKKENNESGSCDLVVTPVEYNPSVLSPMTETATLEMRLSPEPSNRELIPTPERRARSPLERANSLDLPSDQDSPIPGSEKTYFNNDVEESEKVNVADSNRPSEEGKQSEHNNEVPADAKLENTTIHTIISTNSCNSFIVINKIDNDKEELENSAESLDKTASGQHDKNFIPDDSTYTIESSQSYEKLDEKNAGIDNQCTGVSSSMDNIDEIETKSMSIEIIQSSGKLDDTILSVCTIPGKNVFRESHSLELLEESNDSKSYKNKRHCRNKSITLAGQPQFWKSADVLHKSSSLDKNSIDIDAQLICYDEAMRQLANVNKMNQPTSSPNSMPEEKMETKLVNSPVSEKQVMPVVEDTAREFVIVSQKNEVDSGCQTDSINYPDPAIDSDHDSLDKDSSFPPPPVYFEDFDIIHINSEDLCPPSIDVNLPLPISMLTPIKENHFECDSLSLVETNDGDESEGSEKENPNINVALGKSTPSHFNVEVMVNNNSNRPQSESPSELNSISNICTINGTDQKDYTYEMDDVFVDDSIIPEHYEKYFVDVKALQFQPSSVDLSKIIIPADSPSPKSKPKTQQKNKCEGTNSPEMKGDKTSSKFPSLNFVIGGICNVNCNKAASDFILLDKTDNETECIGRPLRRKRKLLLAMRGTGVGGSKESDVDNEDDDEEDDIDDEEDSDEEDPPFWQSTDKGGYFMRQNTVVTMSPKDLAPTITVISNKQDFITSGSSQVLTVRQSCGTPTGSSEAETASASDTPKHSLSPMIHRGKLQAHLREATLEKGKLEETAANLLDKAERLQYELEDSRQAEAARDDTISILQTQLTRLECRYAKAQEELCTLRQRASNAEHELQHLRELCSNKHLEDEKKMEEEKNQRLVHHLEEVLMTNQSMIAEREALIAQNIADVRKLQEDTICWKERYEECAAKLEMMDKLQDPRLIEAQDTIATLKRTIAILQQEKSSLTKVYDASTNTMSPKPVERLNWQADLEPDIRRRDFSSKRIDATLKILEKELNLLKAQLEDKSLEQMKTAFTIDGLADKDAANRLLKKIENEQVKKVEALHHVNKMLDEIQQRIEVESQFEQMQRQLENEFVSKQELENLKNLQDQALERIKLEAINASESKISMKLSEMNELIKRQIQDQSRLERARTNNEISLKQKFEYISSILQSELSSIQAALKVKEAEEVALKKRCEQMSKDMDLCKDYKCKMDRSLSLNFGESSHVSSNRTSGDQKSFNLLRGTSMDSCISSFASLDKTKSDIKKQARPSLEEEFLEDLKEKYLHKK